MHAREKKLLSSWWKQGGRKNVNRPLANRKKERIAHLPVRITARRERDKKRDTHPKQIKVSWVIIFLFFSNRWGSDFKATKINCFQLISQHYSQTKTPKFAFRLFFLLRQHVHIYIFFLDELVECDENMNHVKTTNERARHLPIQYTLHDTCLLSKSFVDFRRSIIWKKTKRGRDRNRQTNKACIKMRVMEITGNQKETMQGDWMKSSSSSQESIWLFLDVLILTLDRVRF